jgi:hypothetical protein
MKTWTGSLDLAVVPAGRHTLTTKQSSDSLRGTLVPAWAQSGPKLAASRTPVQAGAGCGDCQRRAPEGSAAYGTPRKRSTPPEVAPRTAPASVVMTGRSVAEAGGGVVSASADITKTRAPVIIDKPPFRVKMPIFRSRSSYRNRVRWRYTDLGCVLSIKSAVCGANGARCFHISCKSFLGLRAPEARED